MIGALRVWRLDRAVRRATAGLVVALLTLGAANAAPLHPLDPLTADELAQVKTILAKSGAFSRNTDFSWVALDEPPKHSVGEFKPGSDFARRASVAAIDFDKRRAFDVIVDLKAARIASLTDLNDLAPGLSEADDERARTIIDADETIKAALTRRGLSMTGKVSDSLPIQFGPIGYDRSLLREGEPRRLVRALFGSDQNATNEFSPFLPGFMAVVDLYAGRVVKLYDNAGPATVKVPHDIFDSAVRGAQTPAKPVVPPRSAKDFKLAGNILSWRNWQFRFGFNPREGLVLYQIAFNDGGRARPIVYRAAVADVLTAYADASENWSWMELLDEGVFGLGVMSIDVKAGREVPANAALLSPVMADASKQRFSSTFKNRIYVYERDAGGLMHYRQGNLSFHARATELVIGFMASLGNYVYGFNWVFKQDGAFVFEAELAGEIATTFVAAKECGVCKALAQGPGSADETRTYSSNGEERHGALVHPNLVGIHHQHWFNLRLDFDVDGPANAVMENNLQRTEAQQRDGAANADRFFTTAHTVFGKAADAKRDAHEETARTWTIYNPSSLRRAGRPAGYMVVPVDAAATMFGATREKDPVGFTFHHFWVTPYREGQLYASGRHPGQAGANYTDTLYHYANDEPVYDKDIVVWYSLGETHVTRPEDYPVMTNAKVSVVFRPDGFFDRNPVLGAGSVYKK
jgi:primary-amine oxidase